MSQRKIIVYQKNSTKPIILSDDSDQTLQDLKTSILELFKSDQIYYLETTNDILIGRPTDLQSILITNKQLDKEEINSEGKKESKYQQELKIDE